MGPGRAWEVLLVTEAEGCWASPPRHPPSLTLENTAGHHLKAAHLLLACTQTHKQTNTQRNKHKHEICKNTPSPHPFTGNHTLILPLEIHKHLRKNSLGRCMLPLHIPLACFVEANVFQSNKSSMHASSSTCIVYLTSQPTAQTRPQ